MTIAAAAPAAPAAPSPNQAAPAVTETGGHRENPSPADAKPDDAQPVTLKQALKAGTKARKAAKAAEAKGEPVKTAAAAPEAPKEQPAKPDEVTAEALFADDALSTPEGVKRAREVIQTARTHIEAEVTKLDRAHASLRIREKKFGEREASVVQRETQANRYIDMGKAFMADMATITGKRVAAPAEIAMTLDRLAGGKGDPQAGAELAEAILVAFAADGKEAKPSRGEQALRSEMEAMRQRYERDRADARQQAEAAQLEGLKNGVAQLERAIGIAANTPAFPTIHDLVTTGATSIDTVIKIVADSMEEHMEETGQPLDMKSAIGMLEERAKLLRGAQPAQAETGAGDLTAETKPRTPARQSTVLPSDADRSLGTGRQESADQRRQRLARDPNYLKRSGLSKFLS